MNKKQMAAWLTQEVNKGLRAKPRRHQETLGERQGNRQAMGRGGAHGSRKPPRQRDWRHLVDD